jgi:hypothetical protein
MIRTVGNSGESAVPVAYETDTAVIIGFRSEADHSVAQAHSTFNPQFEGGTIDDICADLGLGRYLYADRNTEQFRASSDDPWKRRAGDQCVMA